MKSIKISLMDVLRRLGQDQGLPSASPSIDRLLTVVLSGVTKIEAGVVLSDLDVLLSNDLSDEELNIWWRSCPAEIYFHRPEDVRAFLKAMKNVLEAPPFV